MVLHGRQLHTPESLFKLALFGSACLDGQPLRCSGFVPGVSLRITVAQHPSSREIRPETFALQVWRSVWPFLENWLADPGRVPGFTVEIERGGIVASFARDEVRSLRPGVMEIEGHD